MQQPIDGPGYYQGRHFSAHVPDVEELKRAGWLDEAERLLVGLINAMETEYRPLGIVAPWYYEELAKVYRKQKDYVSEAGILERYMAKQRPDQLTGLHQRQLSQRLDKARALLSRTRPESGE